MIKRKLINKLKRYHWELYITRPIDLLTAIANARAYGEDLKDFAGFEFKILPYLSTNGLVEYFRDSDEQSNFIKRIREIIIQSPDKIIRILNDSEKYNKILKSEINNINNKIYDKLNLSELGKIFGEKYLLFQHQFMPYVIPYIVGIIDENYDLGQRNLKIKKILSLSKKLRLVSLYVDYRNVVIGKILQVISKKASLKDKKIINFFTPEEICLLCLGSRDFLTNSKDRSNSYFFVKFKKKEALFFESSIITQAGKIFKKDVFLTTEKDIKGTAAYKGKVAGIVKIVYGKKDFKKFKKGDILVTIHSNPSLLHVIRKCGAIIADEGGITSHAAIVSREFKIPCVMGTKVATKVLKDGDLVEVDAERGVVKILRSK